MSALTGQIAFEIDEETLIATVVYFGPINDDQVRDFYLSGQLDAAASAGYNFLLDLRHTHWHAKPETIRAVALHVRRLWQASPPRPGGGRIASVRPKTSTPAANRRDAHLREEFGSDQIRDFEDIGKARVWLSVSAQPATMLK